MEGTATESLKRVLGLCTYVVDVDDDIYALSGTEHLGHVKIHLNAIATL